MSNIPQKNIRRKVFAAFFVLFAISVATFFYSYVSIVKLFDTFSSAPASTNKLALINQTLVKIYESETNAKLYAASGDIEYLENYTLQNCVIDSNLQVLRNISFDAAQQLQLVNVLVLQNQKNKVVDELIQLKLQRFRHSDYAALMDIKKDTVKIQLKQKIYSSSNVSAGSEVPFKRRTFFQRLKALFKEDPIPVGAHTNLGLKRQVDSSEIVQTKIDDNIDELKERLRNIKNHEERIEDQLDKRELELLKKEKMLNDRMLFQITQMSQEEIRINNAQMHRFDAAALEYKHRLILLGFSSFFLVLIFIFLIFRDIRVSAHMQKKLEESNEKIQDLLKVKERFLANMSHEIRTPLSAIIGFSDYLIKKKTYSEEEMSAISSSARHLNAIVNEILDYSKVESNAIELENTVFSISSLLQEIIAELRIKANEKNIGLRLNSNQLPLQVVMDRLRLKQVLLNLISNAIKFTSTGEVVVNARIHKGCLVIDIIDTGIGIPKNAQEKIFDEFTQADGSVARKFGGTGLGLSISRKLIELMGGSLSLISEEQVGSTFSISFPINKLDVNEIVPITKEISTTSTKKILFIDDDSFVRLLMSKLLNANEIEFEETDNGFDGIEKYRKGDYDLVITDLHMPKISGLEVAKKIIEIRQDAKILFLSADMSETMVNQMYEVGASGVLQKPFTEQELLKAISNMAADVEKENAIPFCNIMKIKAFIGDDQDELKVIINTFISSTEEALQFILKNNKVGNEQAIADKAHKMLTGFRQFEIIPGVELLREIEKCRNEKYLHQVQIEINELQKNWIEVKRYLNKYL